MKHYIHSYLKNPQIYEDILSCLCFFPNLKYIKKSETNDLEKFGINTNVDDTYKFLEEKKKKT